MSECLHYYRDVWRQCVARYLRCVDLCTLMSVSQEWFYFWINDASWSHQRNRVCARFPALKALFKAHAAPAHNKKRKTACSMPRKGVWHVFRRFLSQCGNMTQFKNVCRDPALECLAISVLRIHVPYDEKIVKTQITHHVGAHSNREGSSRMYTVHMWTDDDSWIEFMVLHGKWNVRYTFYRAETGKMVTDWDLQFYDPGFIDGPSDPWFFRPWCCFILQSVGHPSWTHQFAEQMRCVK
jgi:hypothetical protein